MTAMTTYPVTMKRSSLCSLKYALLLAALTVGCSPGADNSGGTPVGPPSGPGSAKMYYVNCSLGSNGDGTLAAPWNNLNNANSQHLAAGDELQFARGTNCKGELIPRGSGTSSAVVTIGAYGTGALPIIDGGNNNYALYLNDVEYYQINNLAIVGSKYWAVRAGSANSDRGLSGGSVLWQPKMAEKRRTDEQTSTQEPFGGVQGEGGFGGDPRREDFGRTGRTV